MAKNHKLRSIKHSALYIDILDVLLSQYEPQTQEELDEIQKNKEWRQSYIMWNSNTMCNQMFCNRPRLAKFCACSLRIYKIRPHTFELMKTLDELKAKYKIIATSCLPLQKLKLIVDHLEQQGNFPGIFDQILCKKSYEYY